MHSDFSLNNNKMSFRYFPSSRPRTRLRTTSLKKNTHTHTHTTTTTSPPSLRIYRFFSTYYARVHAHDLLENRQKHIVHSTSSPVYLPNNIATEITTTVPSSTSCRLRPFILSSLPIFQGGSPLTDLYPFHSSPVHDKKEES